MNLSPIVTHPLLQGSRKQPATHAILGEELGESAASVLCKRAKATHISAGKTGCLAADASKHQSHCRDS